MSDDKPDCCECKLERSGVELINLGFNTAFYYPVVNEDLSEFAAAPDDPTARVRGAPAGEFTLSRPVKAVVHSDWCKHRPTKALVQVRHDTAAPNGTVRVFVEGARDFSKYVWAEIEYQAGIEFPELDERYHTADSVPSMGGGYGRVPLGVFSSGNPGPVFGISNGTHVASFLSLEDPDDYIKSPWPVFRPTHSIIGSFDSEYPSGSIAWIGTRCRVRWGYRETNADTVLGTVAFIANHAPGFAWFNTGFNPTGALFGLGTLAIGCNWSDIAAPNETDTVRCGVELLQSEGVSGFHGYFQNITTFGLFTIPFEMPRSFFVNTDVEGDPKPALPYRLVGLEATAPRITVPVRHKPVTEGGASPAALIYGDSTNLDAYSFESVVTCGARRSAVFIPPSLQTQSGTLPAGPVGPAEPPEDGIIRNNMPLFVRRDDLNERSYNQVANADSWHATHLVRAGTTLAGRNVLHNLNIEIDPCEFQAGNFGFALAGGYISPGPMRAALVASGSDFQTGNVFGQSYNLPTSGTRFSVQFASDTSSPGDSPFPDAYLWDSISGSHTLTPFGPTGATGPTDERLVPNAYHVFYSEPTLIVESDIVAPQGYLGAGSGNQIDPIDLLQFAGPFVPERDQVGLFADYESFDCPARLRDYRGEWKIETFPQIWATTKLNTEFQRVGPRDISLEESGMTTENHDAYSGGGYRLDYVPENAGVLIRFYCRVGLKITLSRVQGFRRIRETYSEGVPVFGEPFVDDVWGHRATAEVGIYGDFSPNDVGCHDQTFEWSVSLTGEEVSQISAGETVTKQLLIATDVYRTVRISVEQAQDDEEES